MPTDAQLRDAAWVEFEQTTKGWQDVKGYKPDVLAKTHWGRGKAIFDQIGATTPIPPQPTTPPLMDMRATRISALPVSGRGGSETPSTAFDRLTYQCGDISLVADPRWTQVFRVHMHQNADWYASSHNPWGSPADPWHQVPNSGEIINPRAIADMEEAWYAESVRLLSPFHAISRAAGWGIVGQYGYGTLVGGTTVSPPVSIAVEAEGVGMDCDGGVFSLGTWTGQYHKRLNFVPIASVTDKWLDVVIGVRWTMSANGMVQFATRCRDNGETAF